MLKEAVVITFEDGTKQVAERIRFCDALDCKKEDEHMLYKDMISKEYFTDVDCDDKIHPVWTKQHYISKYSIINEEGITKYLTEEEIKTAGTEGLKKEEIIEIVVRINSFEAEEKVMK